TLDLEPTDTIADVKRLVEEQTGIPSHAQTITFDGKVLEDGRNLADYNVQTGSSLQLLIADNQCKKFGWPLSDTRISASAPDSRKSSTRLNRDCRRRRR